MKPSVIKVLASVTLGLVTIANISMSASAQEVKDKTVENEQVKDASIENTAIEDKAAATTEGFEKVYETKAIEDKAAETKAGQDKENKSEYVKDSGEKEPDLYEMKDLPKSVTQMILAGSLVLTFIAVMIGTGRSIKYDSKSKH